MALFSHSKDGGYKSRKLWLVVFAVLMLVVPVGIACKWSTVISMYPTFVGGVVALVTAYIAGNAVVKKVTKDSVPEQK